MSNIPFVESVSADPVVRAIARKVSRILNDPALGPRHRETLVRQAQQELLAHQQRVQQQVDPHKAAPPALVAVAGPRKLRKDLAQAIAERRKALGYSGAG